MKNKIILIGAINQGGVPTCGETMKNQLFVKRFGELFDKVITVDTLNWKRRPWVLVRLLFTLLLNMRAKVIISASGAATYLISFLYRIPICRNVYFWVVGGNLAQEVRKGKYNLAALRKLRRILVQGESMVRELSECGLNNVTFVPNSKPILFTPTNFTKEVSEPYRFVFLSRIHPSKGIVEICEAAKILNEGGYQGQFSVDFYGKVEPAFADDFHSMIQPYANLSYRGFLNLTNADGYKCLSQYDVMLFPTYWSGEGFPGIVIDANMSGLPLIASDWNMNKEVIEEGKTGIIIPIHDSGALADAMLRFISGEEDLAAMKRYSVEYVQQFDFRNVLSVGLMQQIGLM